MPERVPCGTGVIEAVKPDQVFSVALQTRPFPTEYKHLAEIF